MKNEIQLLAISTTILMIVSMGYIIPVDASHGTKTTFGNGMLQYKCDNSLNNLDVESINPCVEFGVSASIWSNDVPKLYISKTTQTSRAEIIVLAGEVRLGGSAISEPDKDSLDENGKVTLNEITFSTSKKWGTQTDDWWHNFLRHDFQTIALHELGHALGLAHDNDSNLMKTYTASWDVQRTIPAHDLSTVKEKFK